MERKKNIISIIGEDTYGCEGALSRLKEAFRERQDGQNIDTYILEEVKDWKTLQENIQTIGLFAEKRLFIFRWWGKKEDWVTSRKVDPKIEIREKILLWICEHIDDDTFIIFFGDILSPKWVLRPWIEKNADVRKFDTPFESSLWEKRFPDITKEQVWQVLSEYRKMVSMREEGDKNISMKIAHTLEKVSLWGKTWDLNDSIENSGWGKIFDLIDIIMRSDIEKALSLLRKMLENTSVYALHPSLLSLIRTNIYVLSLKSLWKSVKEVGTLLTAHPYVIEKAYRSTVSYEKLLDFYKKLLSINTAYRSGRWLYDPELWRIFAIERALMGLKK